MPPTRRHYQIYIDRPPEAVFAFHADLSNHPRTSPPQMREQVLKGLEEPLGEGARVVFRARHAGRWQRLEAEIVQWDPPVSFVSRQVRGPFRAWTHRHAFRPFQSGTLLTDQIEYQLPYGILGRLADQLWVGPHLDRFFAYRQSAAKIFLEQEE